MLPTRMIASLSVFHQGEQGWVCVLQCPLTGGGGIGGMCFLRSLNRPLSHIVVTAAPKQRCKLPFICLFIPPVFTEHFAAYGGTSFGLENFTVDKTSQEHRSERGIDMCFLQTTRKAAINWRCCVAPGDRTKSLQ